MPVRKAASSSTGFGVEGRQRLQRRHRRVRGPTPGSDGQGDALGPPNAASIAGLFLTTEAVIVDKPEEKASAMPGGGMEDY
ncbi:MAG: hypothetical protein WKF43_02205 [Acidimicrobiales bacterium]